MSTAITTQLLRMHASYLEPALFQLKPLLLKIRQDLKASGVVFDTIVGRGISGALVCPVLARNMRKSFMLVRKPDENHSPSTVEGSIGGRWLFVDDLIESGKTLRQTHAAICEATHKRGYMTEFVGAYFYRSALVDNAFGPSDLYGFHDAERVCARAKIQPEPQSPNP